MCKGVVGGLNRELDGEDVEEWEGGERSGRFVEEGTVQVEGCY